MSNFNKKNMYKAGTFAFKDYDSQKRVVTGMLSAFDNIDSDNDIIRKGSYESTIRQRGPEGTKQIKYLLDHDTKKAVGVFNVLKETDEGLYYEATIGTHSLGKDYAEMVESGIITEHSVAINVTKSTMLPGNIREIKEVTLFEGSGLQFLGANSNTPILGLKSETDVLKEIAKLEQALKSGNFTDETFVNVIIPRLDALKNSITPEAVHFKNFLNTL